MCIDIPLGKTTTLELGLVGLVDLLCPPPPPPLIGVVGDDNGTTKTNKSSIKF